MCPSQRCDEGAYQQVDVEEGVDQDAGPLAGQALKPHPRLLQRVLLLKEIQGLLHVMHEGVKLLQRLRKRRGAHEAAGPIPALRRPEHRRVKGKGHIRQV
jgi:hypothetical protein